MTTTTPGGRITSAATVGVLVVLAIMTVVALVGSGPTGPPGPTTALPAEPAVADAGASLARPLEPSDPVGIEIPAIGLTRDSIMRLGIASDESLEVPGDAETVGWYSGGAAPGSAGPAVFASHVNYGGEEGGFARLAELAPGDDVLVDREDGMRVTFVVDRVTRAPKDAFPTSSVYGDTEDAQLRLVTCGGAFDAGARSYEDNVIVYGHATRAAGS